MKANIDKLAPQKHLIDLKDYRDSGEVMPSNFELGSVYGDVIIVAPIDENDLGEVDKGGIFIPQNAANSAWRTGLVVLTGKDVKEVEPGEYVIYPNDRGFVVKNLEIKDFGKVAVAAFLNEERLFGKCHPKEFNILEDAAE
jgi:co-chaperonin GroES (HSP10)